MFEIRVVAPFPMGHEMGAEVQAVSEDCNIMEGDWIAYLHPGGLVAGSDYRGCFAVP